MKNKRRIHWIIALSLLLAAAIACAGTATNLQVNGLPQYVCPSAGELPQLLDTFCCALTRAYETWAPFIAAALALWAVCYLHLFCVFRRQRTAVRRAASCTQSSAPRPHGRRAPLSGATASLPWLLPPTHRPPSLL